MKIHTLDTQRKDEIQEQFQVSDLCAKIFAAKQLETEQIQEVLREPILCDPFLAHGIKEVVQRIEQAKANNEKVLVCGDYDADGICATTIMYDALVRFGITCGFYIPNRFKEGYGLHPNTVNMAKDKEYGLLITVDNGVKAKEALALAKSLAMDVIVTDHHTMDEEILCTYLLHPQHMGDEFQYLCGAGVALQIARALVGDVHEHVVLACVASIGDVMPLWKQTRCIVKLGLQYLREGCCLPLQLLSNDAYPTWEEVMIAFQIVPKLNATGRLADIANTNNTVRYLVTKERDVLISFAKQMNDLNSKRRTMSTKMSDHAKRLVVPEHSFQVLYDDTFHEGMVGLVAGKLADVLHQPIMVLAATEDGFKGSIRSYGNVDLRTFFDDVASKLTAYGGHKAAAGIGFLKADLPEIIDYCQSKMATYPQTEEEEQVSVIACHHEELSIENVEGIACLAPFGQGFEKPTFYIPDYPVASIKELSNHKHVKWESLEHIEALYFNAKDVYAKYKDEKQLAFLGSLSINHFRNEKKVNIFVQDII